jgi:hypothetical protein
MIAIGMVAETRPGPLGQVAPLLLLPYKAFQMTAGVLMVETQVSFHLDVAACLIIPVPLRDMRHLRSLTSTLEVVKGWHLRRHKRQQPDVDLLLQGTKHAIRVGTIRQAWHAIRVRMTRQTCVVYERPMCKLPVGESKASAHA